MLNGWPASINTKEIYEALPSIPNQGGAYWIGAGDLSKEGTYVWTHGEPWKFSPPWENGQPGDSNTIGNKNTTRGGQNCLGLDDTHEMFDRDCNRSISSFMCMTHMVHVGLGGQVEGQSMEHGGNCDNGASYQVERIVEITDDGINLTPEYIAAFYPAGYIKAWVR